MDIIDKIINVLTKPYKFFENLKKEKGIKEAFIYLAILFFISTVLGTIFGMLMQSFSTGFLSRLIGVTIPEPEVSIGWILFWALVGYALGLGLSFVWAGILHVWILIFGGKADYTKTYQLAVYSNTPGYIFGWFPMIGYVIWIYNVILLIIGTEKVHGISRLRAILMYVIPVALIMIFYVLIIILVITVLGSNPDLLKQAIAQA